MRDLNTNEILMIDGGGERGGFFDRQGEIWGGNLACGLAGAAVGAITKNAALGLTAGVVCGGLAGNLGNANASSSNHRGGDYHGHAGGMDGSSTGFGR